MVENIASTGMIVIGPEWNYSHFSHTENPNFQDACVQRFSHPNEGDVKYRQGEFCIWQIIE